MKEIEILSICQHPNIISLKAAFENIDKIYLVMELADFSLFELLKKKGKLDEKTTAKYMIDVIRAI